MSDTTASRAMVPASAPTPAACRGAEITELCSYLYAAEYRLLTLIREFDERKYWEEAGFCSCTHWLNFHCGIGMPAARERVRVARALTSLPKISATFERKRCRKRCQVYFSCGLVVAENTAPEK